MEDWNEAWRDGLWDVDELAVLADLHPGYTVLDTARRREDVNLHDNPQTQVVGETHGGPEMGIRCADKDRHIPNTRTDTDVYIAECVAQRPLGLKASLRVSKIT